MPFWLHEHKALRMFKSITPVHKIVVFVGVALCMFGIWAIVVYGPLQHQLHQKKKELKNLAQQKKVSDGIVAGYSMALNRYKKLCNQHANSLYADSFQHLLTFFLTSLHQHNVTCCSLVPGEVITTPTHTTYQLKLVALGDYHDVQSMLEWLGSFEHSVAFSSVDIVPYEGDFVRFETVFSVQQLKKECLEYA